MAWCLVRDRDNFTFNCICYVPLNCAMTVNDEIKRIRKEAAVGYLKILPQNLHEGTEKIAKIKLG